MGKYKKSLLLVLILLCVGLGTLFIIQKYFMKKNNTERVLVRGNVLSVHLENTGDGVSPHIVLTDDGEREIQVLLPAQDGKAGTCEGNISAASFLKVGDKVEAYGQSVLSSALYAFKKVRHA